MKSIKALSCLFFVLLTGCDQQHALPELDRSTALQVSLEPEQITVGDPATLSLTLWSTEATDFPEPDNYINPALEILELETGAPLQIDTLWKREQRLTLTSFRTNSVPYEVFRTNQVELRTQTPVTLPLPFHTIEVVSVLSNNSEFLEAAFEIPDLRGPAVLAKQKLILWIITIAALLVGVIAFIGYRVSKKRYARPPPLPRWDLLALNALNQLRASPEWAAGHHDYLAVQLSSILRDYIEKRYELNAPDLTTEEFLEHTRIHAPWDSVHQEPLNRFLQQVDAIKFAGKHPSFTLMEELHDKVRDFVTTTRIQQLPQPEVTSDEI